MPESEQPASFPKGSPTSSLTSSIVYDRNPAIDTISHRYQFIREMGHGSTGMVYLAQDQKLNRYVAIKRLTFQSGSRTIIQKRFLREAQTIASLGHIHIVNIFDIGKDENGYYIVMEYVSGPQISEEFMDQTPPPAVSLQNYVRHKGTMNQQEAIALILKVCTAMEYAHNRNIIHRDIKPSNILLTDIYDPKIVDFGLARPINTGESQLISLHGGEIPINTDYVAPELWAGDSHDIDARVDVYSIAGVLWFLISGEIPKNFKPAAISEGLQKILIKALAQKRNDRQVTIKELADQLRSYLKLNATSIHDVANDQKPGIRTTDMWKCPECTKMNPDNAKYCIKCGSYGMELCPICESEIRCGTQFCPNCGIDVKRAETASTFIVNAKNQAAFKEYEAALNSIKDLDTRHHPELVNLAKEWRQLVLQRRNLLTDLDSCIRVYNLEKAAKIYNELKVMVPEECLSESPDFDMVVKFSSLANEFIEMLRESATRAQNDYNLDKFTAAIALLNEVCGAESCQAINQALSNINTELNNLVTKAGLALGMNCISRALDIVLSATPWKGGELGQRRNRMVARCEDLIKDREQLVDNLEESLRKGQYSEAVQFIRKTTQFRLPPNYSEMEPDHDDLAAHERIVQVDKILQQKFESVIPSWIEKDNWTDIKNALTVLRGDDATWKKMCDDLRNRVNKKIAARYNDAVQMEGRGRLNQAEKLWNIFLSCPEELVPVHLWQYAEEFYKRRAIVIQSRMNRLIKRLAIVLWVTWAWPLWKLLYHMVMRDLGQSIKHVILPGSVNLVLFLVGTIVLFNKKLIRAELQHDSEYKPKRVNLLFFLMALSPLSYGLHQIFSLITEIFVPGFPGYLAYVAVTLVWLTIDLFRRYAWQFPGAFSLTISWVILSTIAVASHKFHLPNYYFWPGFCLLHGLSFLSLLYFENKQKEKLKAVESPAPAPAIEDIDI